MGIKFVEHCLGICDQLAKDAVDHVQPCDERRVADFAKKLCGLEGLDCNGMRERLAGVEMPGDFRHLRVTNLSTDMPWGGVYHSDQRPLKLDEIIVHMACTARLGRATPCGNGGVWTATVALPIRDPGVLELGVIFRRRH